MRSTACALSATVLLLVFVLQTLGAPTDPRDDAAYQLFASLIQSEMQQAEYKLNSSWEIYVNNVKTFNIPEFDNINSTLYNCFEEEKAKHPDADQFCLDFIEQDVQQTISDSKNELDACTNLTHSWELIDQLLKGAKEAITNLDNVVNIILNEALTCVTRYPYNPSVKNNCFNNVKGKYSTQFNSATSLAHEAFFQISGGGLLLGAEGSSCQKAENFSFVEKCNAIVSEIVINCVPPTTTSTAAPVP